MKLVLVFSLFTFCCLLAENSYAKCVTAGCSSQLCLSEEEAQDLMTTCEFRPEYICYQRYGKCKQQADEKCGWQKSEILDNCLQSEAKQN
jgi:hypothetical protein